MGRMNHQAWMSLRIVGEDKDFIISPDITRGWSPQDKHIGDTQHDSLRAAFQCLGELRTHEPSLVHQGALATSVEQVQHVADELKEVLEKLSLDQGAKDPRQGNAAASSNDPQPLAGQHLLVEGTSSGGQRSVDQFGEQLRLMGCPHLTASPETTKALENAVNLIEELARGGASVDSGGGAAPNEDDGRESEATNPSEATISKVSR